MSKTSATYARTRIFSTEDAIRIAHRRQPRLVHDFIGGAAGREVAVKRNQQGFDKITLQPRVMADVATRSLKTEFLGQGFDRPFGIAPMGMCNLAWPRTDQAFARVAREFNIPICLSTAASSSIEEMREWAGDKAWFQLYVGGPVEQALEMVERARVAGYDTLILTVDVPQVSRRLRDLRNGFQMPFRVGPKQFFDFACHPHWSLATLWHGAPEPKNFKMPSGGTKFDRAASRAGADWTFLDRLREIWTGRLIVKGVTSAQDAVRIQRAGVDAIYISNHGGRQLDSVPTAIELLPRIRDAVGPSYPLIFDSGVRSGEDIIKVLALGADFVMLGRPYLYAAGAEGACGVAALTRNLSEDVSLALAQIGLNDVRDVTGAVLSDDFDGDQDSQKTVVIPGLPHPQTGKVAP